MIAALIPLTSTPAQASSVVAFDMVGSASQNLISYTNPSTGAFSSGGDGFEKYQRWVSPSIPYSIMDDSLSIYTGDSLGIVKEGNTDEFFGVTDTVNGDNTGPVSATWVFDVSGATDMALSIDMGAMGDFESSDTFVWEYQFDSGTVETAFASSVDEAGSNTYILEGGSSYTLNDPMLVDGTILTNDLATFTAPLTGSGSSLTLTLTASTNGGSEAFAFQNITILADYDSGGGEPPTECGNLYTAIYDIQGIGDVSPLDGTPVVTEGIVVGDFQDGKSGYFIQDPFGDADPATSDGVFVYGSNPDVVTGDHVRVTGTVDEFYGLTQIKSVSLVETCGADVTVAPTNIALPVASVSDFEAYEGMLVTFPQSLSISEYYNFGRFGEIVLTTDRQFQPTAVYDPGSDAAEELASANALSRIKLDDGRGSQNPDPALHPDGGIFDLGNLFRGGDTLDNVTGVMDFTFGEYKIQPTQGADHANANPRTATPADVGGNITVATFNVLNYFTTFDSRGADDQAEFDRQRDKIFAALAAMDADVVGLVEIENNGTAVADLVDGLNAVVGADTYDFVDTGVIGPDQIAVAYIYKPATVSLVGDFAALDDPAFLDPNNLGSDKNRPALAQTFMDNNTGGIFTAVVNHLKSKGSPCGPGDDDPEAGSCNLTRTMAAEVLADWLASDPTGSGDEDFLIIGDLNSYDKEDPIDALKAAGYSDLIGDELGEYAYSYVFDGALGYLDYAMANGGLADEVTGVTVWHINADEANLIDYDMSYKKDAQDAIYAPDAYRSSDHDPVIVGLDVCDEIAPTIDVTVTPDELWPPKHQYVDVTATVTTADNFDPNPTVTLVSVVSNEPDNGEDDGDTIDDIVIIDDYTFQLRAERSGVGTGRIYTITYEVTDACGNSTIGTATVSVPLSKGKG
ncbi:MAG: ExeM/NucH family extracellular endonuclease [Actinomycetota bacterium]